MAEKVKLSKWPEARIRLTGEAEHGKTTFYIAMARYLNKIKPGDTYIWNTDGRIQEAVLALGETVLRPTAARRANSWARSEEMPNSAISWLGRLLARTPPRSISTPRLTTLRSLGTSHWLWVVTCKMQVCVSG